MQTVKDSSDCCINSKFSAAEKGYFQDNCLSLFVNKLHPRSPIINRGYYIRFRAIEAVFESWLSSINSCSYNKSQIISLGAGYDSSYLRLKSENKLPPGCHYIEIDFLEVMKRKYHLIKDSVRTSNDVPSDKNPAIVLCTDEYSLLGTDLTDIVNLEKCFTFIGINYDAPTLLLSECSLIYIDPKYSEIFISWAQKHFLNSAFVSYEQVCPFDAFGIIMRSHFNQVGCSLKSITKYPDEDSQCERFKKLGWPECYTLSMYNLFSSFSSQEKIRIQQLEMFDEYEMWHEKCHHYALICASQGILSMCFHSLMVQNSVVKDVSHTVMKNKINWKSFMTDEVVQRFGHQVILVSPFTFFISGGFGSVKKNHQRLGDITLYHLSSKKCITIALGDMKYLMGKRIFHTMTKLSSSSVVIIGGRSSPKKGFEDILVLRNCCFTEANNVLFEKYCLGPELEIQNFQMPDPTWRHSASLINIGGTDCIFVFGGCSQNYLATNNAYILNTESWKWTLINNQKNSPVPRHSHSAVTYNGKSIIITGGLTEDETILNSVHLFDCDSMEWNIFPVTGLFPRYSHTSHIWKNHLLLVGGITNVENCNLGIGVVNLETLQAFEVSLPAQDPEYPILLSNHSSYLQNDEIFVVGGGGNCFSFGTHFNKKIVSFNIKEVICT